MTRQVPLGKIPLTIKEPDIIAKSWAASHSAFKPSFAFNLTEQPEQPKKFAWVVRF
jgi:hypothetical protein